MSKMKSSDSADAVKNAFLFSITYAAAYFQKERFSAAQIPSLSIGVTNVCKAKCAHCANRYFKGPRGHMDMSIFKKTVDQFADMGGENIDFCVLIGEPLLDPFLAERARYLKEFPQLKFSGFYTNLQWLHKFGINNFFELGLTRLGISTALSGKDKYYEFFGTDNYGQTLQNIITLIKENNKRRNRVDLNFSFMLTSEPVEYAACHPDLQLVDRLTGGKLIPAVKDRCLYVDDWSDIVKLPIYLKRRPHYLRLFRPCRILYDRFYVFPDGEVGACPCRDLKKELVLGNVTRDSLKELWNGQRLKEMRNNWRRRSMMPAVCKRCSRYLY